MLNYETLNIDNYFCYNTLPHSTNNKINFHFCKYTGTRVSFLGANNWEISISSLNARLVERALVQERKHLQDNGKEMQIRFLRYYKASPSSGFTASNPSEMRGGIEA